MYIKNNSMDNLIALYTLAGFEPTSFGSKYGDADHYTTPPENFLVIFMQCRIVSLNY
jgi:hypothetical protein